MPGSKNTLCQNVFQLDFYTRISILLCICSLIHFLWKKEDLNHKIRALSQLLPSEKKKKAKIVEFLNVLKISIFFHTSNENIEYLFKTLVRIAWLHEPTFKMGLVWKNTAVKRRTESQLRKAIALLLNETLRSAT